MSVGPRMRRGAPGLALVLVSLLAACASGPRGIEFRGETTADGLQRVSSTRLDRVWLRPGASFQPYAKVRIEPVTISYKRPPRGRGARGNFALTAQQKERVQRFFQEAFERELGASQRYAISDAPGPDVLSVRGRIVDLVVEVPPQPAGRGSVFVKRAGVMTLILDVADSESGEPLARFSDEGVVSETGGFRLYESNSVTNAARVRRMFSHWARILRDGLDALHELPEIPVPESAEAPPSPE